MIIPDENHVEEIVEDLDFTLKEQLELLPQFDIAIINHNSIPDIQSLIAQFKGDDQDFIQEDIKLSQTVIFNMDNFKENNHGLIEIYEIETESYLTEFKEEDMLTKGIFFFDLAHMKNNFQTKEITKANNTLSKISYSVIKAYILYRRGSGYDH